METNDKEREGVTEYGGEEEEPCHALFFGSGAARRGFNEEGEEEEGVGDWSWAMRVTT